MTKVYFVRHAQPDFAWEDDRTRPLTAEGKADSAVVVKFLKDKNIVIGTHGTALSSILNYYDAAFDCDDFWRIVDWMPYIIELDFEGTKLVGKTEHVHVYKKFHS